MPRMDGLALTRRTKLSSLPITPVFLVAADISDNYEAILALRVPCLSKPVSLKLGHFVLIKFKGLLNTASAKGVSRPTDVRG
jgi:CheY-like chemotaxis protein